MKKLILFFTISFCFSLLYSQNKIEAPLLPVVKLGDSVTVKFGGFVRADYFIDSHLTVGFVEDLFGLFPAKNLYDSQGNDQNDIIRNYISVQGTRFNALFTGPPILKAKSSSFFEFDFTGGNTINVRLRHAYVKLVWPNTEILLGKTWTPLMVILPSVNALHTGMPFAPFERGDQFRLSFKAGKFTVLSAFLYQNEHKSFSYLNSLTSEVGQVTDNVISNPIPDLHLQLHYKSEQFFAGIVSEYKTVRPATSTQGTLGIFKTDVTISSYALGVFAEYKNKKFTIKGSSLYGQNMSEAFMQGGYAVTTVDLETGERKFTPSNLISSWLDITYGDKYLFGLFGGYSKNLGFSENILSGTGTFLGRWQDIDHIYRISPSFKYTVGRLTFGAEVDYNVAAYGNVDYANKGKVTNCQEIHGTRVLMVTSFLF